MNWKFCLTGALLLTVLAVRPVFGCSGCDGLGGTTPSVNFATQIQPIFNANCTSCHSGAFPSSSMDLSAGNSYANIVNVDSVEVPAQKRVNPGNAGTSYLFCKINCASPTSGSRMPQGGGALSAADQALIRDWIDQGAFPGAPTVAGVSPNGGPLAGGQSVTVTGTNFVAGATVRFDGVLATSVNVTNLTTITCTTPAHVAATVNVVVMNTNGQSGTGTNVYTYRAAPTVTQVVPGNGPATLTTNVTISGTGFVTGAMVTFGGTAATNINVSDSFTITARAPAHAAGQVNVVVTNSDTQSGTLNNGFIYDPAPIVTSLDVVSGPTAGGTAVTITGQNFVTGATVTVGGTPAGSVNVANGTTITLNTPVHAAGLVPVVVTNPDAQTGTLNNAFTYIAPPVLSSVAPNSGATAGGYQVTLTGTNFVAPAMVRFDGVLATGLNVQNPTTAICTVPQHVAGAVNVVFTNSDTQFSTLTNGFTYALPTVTAINPPAGPSAGGTSVTITGTNFAPGATLTIGGTAVSPITVVNATTITATTPQHAVGAGNVVVTNSDMQAGTLTNGFTFAAPTVTQVSPPAGSIFGLTDVTVTGTHFAAGAQVRFDGLLATNIIVVNSTTITCRTPAHAGAAVNVVVTNTDAVFGTLVSGYTYNAPPIALSLNVSSGPAAGGTAFTLTGTAIQIGATVAFDGVPATSVVVVSSTTVTGITPAHAAGVANLTLTNPDAQSATLNSAFTFIAPPVVTSVSPAAGPSAGGTELTILGTGFAAGATVTVGGVTATNVSVTSAASLTATTPAHAFGRVPIAVTNPDGQSSTLADAFSYANPPAITSQVVVVAGELFSGNEITFAVGASDPQGLPLTFTYAYGDGSSDSTGKHIFSSGGTFTVSVTISNGVTTSSSTVQVVIEAKLPLTISKLQGAANFKTAGKDSASVKGTLRQLPAGFSPAGKTIRIDVGGATAEFVLNAKGQAKAANGTVALKIKFFKNPATKVPEFLGGDVAFQATLKGSLASNWLNEGVDPAQSASKKKIVMPVDVKLDGKVYTQGTTPALTASAGKNAKFSF